MWLPVKVYAFLYWINRYNGLTVLSGDLIRTDPYAMLGTIYERTVYKSGNIKILPFLFRINTNVHASENQWFEIMQIPSEFMPHSTVEVVAVSTSGNSYQINARVEANSNSLKLVFRTKPTTEETIGFQLIYV